ncbi:MAG: phosphodiester glycosidase family protein [Rhizobiaceae bacterium]|nr:phosphodiester glycosidase family protein [Rhizobiaceae bacterium]
MLLAIVGGSFLWWWRSPVPVPKPETFDLPKPCRELAFEAVDYLVCEVELADYDIALRRLDATGKPYRNLSALAEAEPFVFAMNGGMYHEDLSPVGLHVEDGRQVSPLNTADAPGNFFMKPNGVFYTDGSGRAGVMETNAFAASGIEPVLATQSGPMLVIDGSLHPRFEENGASRHIRNGVGADGGTRAVFAISYQPVSLGSFARLFRDELKVRNALFLDGAISAIHDGNKYLIGGGYPAGPMLVVKEKSSGADAP